MDIQAAITSELAIGQAVAESLAENTGRPLSEIRRALVYMDKMDLVSAHVIDRTKGGTMTVWRLR